MTKDEIIRMAREAGFNVEQGYLLRITGIDEDLERFAAIVAFAERESLRESFRVVTAAEASAAILHEREACAKLCEEMRTYVGRNNAVTQSSAQDCATAIRARGQA